MKYFKLFSIATTTLLFSGITVAQECNNLIPHSAPDSRYTINGNGYTVTDDKTTLTWKRCSEGQIWDGSTCSGNTDNITWELALQNAESHSFAGYNDWRLPNVKELASLMEEACFEPSINSYIFPGVPVGRVYWSSSPNANENNGAWYFHFDDNLELNYSKSALNTLRLVRSNN